MLSIPEVITSSSEGGIKNGVTVEGIDSLNSSSADQQRAAVDQGEINRDPSISRM
jgi:hypothetical protein